MVEQFKNRAQQAQQAQPAELPQGGIIGIPDWNPTPAEESDSEGVPPPAPTGIDSEDGGEEDGEDGEEACDEDEELAHVNNVQELRSYGWLQDPLVSAVLDAVSERGERSVSRTIVGRCLQYARMSAARDEALHLSRQALDTAKEYAERARQLSVIVRYELTENA